MAYAFKCKTCGALQTSENAGERHLPAACVVCGSGVAFTPRGIRTFDDDNWLVLADLPDKEKKALADEHDLDVDELIVAHVPAEPDLNPDHEPTFMTREVSESLTTEDLPG